MNEQYGITFVSKLDETPQPALFMPAAGDEPRPLVVALHTWSADLTQSWEPFRSRCEKRNWHCLYPLFRGPNWNRKACGSDLVVSDIESAVEYVKSIAKVDEKRIYLIGGSGGGHASLLMAGRTPQIWAAVSSWCPISDIAKWHAECKAAGINYYEHIEIACDGDPQVSASAAAQAKRRSPVTYLASAAGKTIVDIGTGIHDGHKGSVPVGHAMRAFNLLADEADRISDAEIDFIEKNEAIPENIAYKGAEDIAYGPYKVLLRRVSKLARITIFEGGHHQLPGPGFGFLEQQIKGEAPVWNSGSIYDDASANANLGK